METRLSIIIAVVSGGRSLRRCLEAIAPQIGESDEVIVPWDSRSPGVEELAAEFPRVEFLHDPENVDQLRNHDLYDRRRARGLAAATGGIIAMTEDHAVPADDWVERIVESHRMPYAVIGGAIDNLVDRYVNRAIYFCDFGRYGPPLSGGPAEYVSDVNISYKRDALMSVREIWRDAYHETSVNWALRSKGEILFLDPRPVVSQNRPPIGLRDAWRERIEWGRVFAETRSSGISPAMRLGFAAGTPLLPFLLTARIWKHMRRQRRPLAFRITTALTAFVLLTGWAFGEMTGYLAGSPPAANGSDVTGIGRETIIGGNHQ